ncbi:MAG: hypothetical protein MRY64_15070 [Hyphomonadaceae bacterium]|nr:hypothetical protein [Hyphomonadaceae bacterium]
MTAEADRLLKRLKAIGVPREAVGEESVVLPCPLCNEDGVTIQMDDQPMVRCDSCSEVTPLAEWLDWIEGKNLSAAAAMGRLVASGTSGNVTQLHPNNPSGSPAQEMRPSIPEAPDAAVKAEAVGMPHRSMGETLIIALLSLVFLGAGLLATTMSGFANYQAFGAMVDDPLQSRVWAWTGIIASVCSFGGFTFVYWHGAGARMKEAARTLVFALAGAATSLVGTQMYMHNTAGAKAQAAEAAGARAGVLEAQIEDWRTDLAGIPDDVRSIEGLEAYVAEVERVGRTHEKPYRDALGELGQARRRADLQVRIEDARAELADLSVAALAADTPTARRGPWMHWFFAAMLEVFSSQATSIGFVALMILAGRRQAAPG